MWVNYADLKWDGNIIRVVTPAQIMQVSYADLK